MLRCRQSPGASTTPYRRMSGKCPGVAHTTHIQFHLHRKTLHRKVENVSQTLLAGHTPPSLSCEHTAQCATCYVLNHLYRRVKPIRYELTSLTIRAVRPASVARARRLASRLELSGSTPAAMLYVAAPRASSPPSSNAVARGRDSPAPRAEPRADLSSALAQQRVACAVEGAVILLCRERDGAGHAGTPQSPRRC